MPALKRRPLKTLPWEKMSVQLRAAVKAWIDSGGDPKMLDKVSQITKAAQAVANAATPHRPRRLGKLPGYLQDDDMSLFDRITESTDRRREPGSVEWPKGHGSYGRDPSKKLLPGDVDILSKKQLGHRSHQQRLARSGNRFVTFSNGIAEKTISVIESTPLRAAREARKRSKLNAMWKITKIDGVKWTGPQK